MARVRRPDVPPYEFEALDPLAWTPRRFLRRHAERNARRRRLRRLLTLGLALILGFGFLLADGGLVSILAGRWRIRCLEREVAALESRQQWLHRELELRQGDSATIERLAREEYGMVRPGERVVRILEVSEEEARRVEAARRAARLPVDATNHSRR
ncbi:MAG: septum formation initiator family protein [Candidatus Latescibacterota bacterium]|nr:MAG: septum formation initiator family protein [Candidatus Latescibacterota bacterium]